MLIIHDQQKDCTLETIRFLHAMWQMKENGSVINPSPFYDRNSLLTEEIVEKVVDGLEGIFTYELQHYRGYHNNRNSVSSSEVLIPPGFDKWGYSEKLALVQGVDEIFQKYRAPYSDPAPVAAPEYSQVESSPAASDVNAQPTAVAQTTVVGFPGDGDATYYWYDE